MESSKSTGSVTDPANKTDDDYTVIDSTKVPHGGVQTQQTVPTDDSNNHHQQIVEAAVDVPDQNQSPAIIETVRQRPADQEGDLPEGSPETPPSKYTGIWCHSCDICRSLSRHCDYQYPVCGHCSASAPRDCTWDGPLTQPLHQPHQPDDHNGEASFNLDFSELGNEAALENFDFDSFLNSADDQFDFSVGTNDEIDDTDYWRSTVAVAEPVADVERPRPRPRGV